MKVQTNCRGFTLLETILALMVFSIAVIALVEVIARMGDASTEARRSREVQSQLESLMLEATRLPPNEIIAGQPSYEKTTKDRGVEYHLVMNQVQLTNQDGQQMSGLYSIKVTAFWSDGGAKLQASAESMVYPPLFYVQH
jgi:prepilin-type N-terminal cleavage/methylation domain-containing protein